jgi:hypothetical protein
MANSISFSAGLNLSGTGISLSGNGSASAVQAGTNAIEDTTALSTTTSQISIGSIVTMGYLYVKNLDATNNVRIGLVTPVTSGNAFVTLQPGEFTIIPTRQTVIYAISVAATPQILVLAVEL